ncbi:hypothetical protein GCM10020258_35350 [Sphingomonas yabuuchiae]
MTALYTRSTDAVVRDAAEALARPLGLAPWVEDEGRFDAVTALAGCGPAFVFRFIDALAQAGVGLGLSPNWRSNWRWPPSTGQGPWRSAPTPRPLCLRTVWPAQVVRPAKG